MRQERQRRPIRVCMVVPYLDEAGGMEKQALQLARHLARDRGLEISILTTVYPRKFWKCLKKRKLENKSVPIYRLPVPGRGGMFLPFFALLGITGLVFLRNRYDIVHCHQLFSAGVIGAFVRILFCKPVLVKAACGGVQGDVWTAERSMFPRVIRSLLAGVDLFVCLSVQIYDEIQGWIGCSRRHLVRLPNAVDVECFHPVDSRRKAVLRSHLSLSCGEQVLFVGRLDARKGIDTLVELWPDVADACPKAHLTVLGSGPMFDSLEKLCRKRGVENSVSFQGRVENVPEYLQAADLLVLPSLSEGVPNVVLEAMACGLPVVATRIGGTCETVQDGVTGLLVEVGDRAALKEAIVRVLTQPEVRKRLGRVARERVEKVYSLQAVAEQYIALYKRLLY